MKRKVYTELLKWKEKSDRKPLILRGARQVGKTWIMKEFGHEVVRINMVMTSIPSQLARENKKFIYGAMRKGARAADFELAIQWLIDCGIVYKIPRVSTPKLPLKFYEDLSAFKLFLLDCGLLACMSEVPADQILIGNNVFEEFKGAFTEEFILQQLVSRPDTFIYYWSSERSDGEVDFLLQSGSRIIPVEVKAEENVRARSLRQFVQDNPDLKGLRFSMSDYRDQGWMENVPLYAAFCFSLPKAGSQHPSA